MKKIKFSNKIIKRRFILLLIVTLICFSVIIYRLIDMIIINNDEYVNKLSIKNSNTYVGEYAKRGRILDRNGNVLVDSEKVISLIYQKNSSISDKKEIEIASKLANILNLDYKDVDLTDLKKYYQIINEDIINKRINENVKKKYETRELSKEAYEDYLLKLITNNEIENLSEQEKNTAYIYALMNKGYKNSIKYIKNDITKEEIEKLNKYYEYGFSIGHIYKRVYPYGDVFRDYLGNIGSIPQEELSSYIKDGYRRDDIVGVSYLEKEYENYLKGKNEEYILTASGNKIITQNLEDGNDIYLSIDINLQKDVEDIIYNQIINAKKEANTSYYNKSFVILSNPFTGEIYASAGVGVLNNKDYKKVSYLTDLTNYAITPGSIVKGASHIVGYKYGAIDIGTSMTDGCIKVKNTPKKCSWKSLGKINDLTALKYSSNYYQFMTAIKIGNGNYKYNAGLSLELDGFKKYREVFNSFGLGVETGIDVPNETIGVVGTDKNSGSLLDYPIGQYETYTPMQLMQYINTLATSGKRMQLHYLNKVKQGENEIYKYEPNIMNEVQIDGKYIERVREGLKMVMESGGTGRSHIDPKYDASGKTGTSQSFIDRNYDGKIDTETTSSSFGAYMPSDKPTLSIVVLSPNVSNRNTSFMSKVNRKITKEVTNMYFTKYK